MVERVDICLLNYNGSDDTIACVESIKEKEPALECRILIYDNASAPDDIANLKQGLSRVFPDYATVDSSLDTISKQSEYQASCILFLGPENIGFAKANNWLLRYGLRGQSNYFVLLNNDTLLVDASISKLISAYQEQTGVCDFATSDIRFFSNPNLSWNAGGSIGFGTRRYNRNKEVERFLRRGKHFPKVSFITGCFLFLPRKTLEHIGLLSEIFFFGEEDYEFCLRAKNKGLTGRVLLDTYILHKVGASISRDSSDTLLARGFIHRLNRLIDMRYHYRPLQWRIWRLLACLYYQHGLIRNNMLSIQEAIAYTDNLRMLSNTMRGVNKEVFQDLIGMGNDFFTTRFSSEWQERIFTLDEISQGDD